MKETLPALLKDRQRLRSTLYLTAVFLTMFSTQLGRFFFRNENVLAAGQALSRVLSAAALLLAIVSCLLCVRENRKFFLLAALAAAAALLCRDEDSDPLLLVLMAAGAKDIDYRSILKSVLAALSLSFFLLFPLCACGVLVNSSRKFSYGFGHSLGFMGQNYLGLCIMIFLFLVYLLWLRDRPFVTAALFLYAAAFVWLVPKCRTVALLLILFPFANLVPKKWYRLTVLLPLLWFALSLVLTLNSAALKGLLDRNMLMRFTHAAKFLKLCGISLFGSTPDYEAVGTVNFDNAYMVLLVRYGLLLCGVILAGLTGVSVRCALKKNDCLLMVCCFLLTFGLMENTMLSVSHNFTMLYLFAADAGFPAPDTFFRFPFMKKRECAPNDP